MNPLCWNVLLLETNGDRYVVRRGMVSVAPALIPASRCPAMSANLATTAPLAVVGARDSAVIHWLGDGRPGRTAKLINLAFGER